MIDLRKHIVHSSDCLKSALEQLNKVPNNLTLFVLDENETLVGTLTDGDVRRGLIRGKQITDEVREFMTCEFSYLKNKSYKVDEIRKIKQRGVKLLPVLDETGKILRVIDFNRVHTILPVDAILMAGGRGERLRPMTDDIPKSLIKIGNKPIIEHNIDRLMQYGVHDFNIAVNYLGEMIEAYFGNGDEKGISIKYVKEKSPLGTIGAVSLIEEFKHDHLLIMNSDLFTNIDFEDFYKTFCGENADVCIATIPYVVDVPYAVLHIHDNTIVTGLQEKPTYTYYANAGIYLIKKKLIKDLSNSIKTDATDFILETLNKGFKITKYPILGYWIDVGNREDYNKANEFAEHTKNKTF